MRAREFVLIARQGNAGGDAAVFRRGANDQRAPATADVQQPMTGLDAQFAEDVVELLFLRSFQRIGVAAKIGAGVHHVAVEKQMVELVGDVVVVFDGLAITLRGMGDRPQQTPDAIGARRRAHELGAHLEDVAQRTFDADPALDIGFSELHQVGRQEAAQRTLLRDHDGHLRIRTEIQTAPIPQRKPQWRRAGIPQPYGQLRQTVLDNHGSPPKTAPRLRLHVA